MGIQNTRPRTQEMLFRWATHILLMDGRFEDMIPRAHKAKLKVFDVGQDRYFLGIHQELLTQVENYIRESGILEEPRKIN